jgi:FlaA1/EpsC-like NDP-sugar epimerase
MFDNATLLITGGTGSFGNTVLKTLFGYECKRNSCF